MAEAHGVTVDIMGRELKIACSEDEREALLNAVGYLDKKCRLYAILAKWLAWSVLRLWPR